MPVRTITFKKEVDDYSIGDTVEMPRHLAKKYIRGGFATTVVKAVTKKRVTKKRVSKKETASIEPPDIERAIEK